MSQMKQISDLSLSVLKCTQNRKGSYTWVQILAPLNDPVSPSKNGNHDIYVIKLW